MNIPKTKIDTFYTGLIGAGLGYMVLKKITQKKWASYLGGFAGYFLMSYGLYSVADYITSEKADDVAGPKVPVAPNVDAPPEVEVAEIPTSE